MENKVQFELNGKKVEASYEGNQTLLWALRTQFNLTGTKFGCGLAQCGACTVLMDGQPARSCSVYIEFIEDSKVVTIEGLEKNGVLHPVQQAFIDHDAFQCGFCTPGMIMNAVGLLNRNPEPTREEIIQAMEGNICRCGAHNRIIDAIEDTSKVMKGVVS